MHRIGFWSPSVDPTRLVDPGWAAGERDAIVRYLRSGRVHALYLGFSFCRFHCGIPDCEMGSRDLTDGTWVWPQGLPHYVDVHKIALPDTFLAHARAAGFVVPDDARSRRDADEPLMSLDDSLWQQWARERHARPPGER